MQDLRLCVKIDSDRDSNGMMTDEKCIPKNELNLSLIENGEPIHLCWDYSYFNMQPLFANNDLS